MVITIHNRINAVNKTIVVWRDSRLGIKALLRNRARVYLAIRIGPRRKKCVHYYTEWEENEKKKKRCRRHAAVHPIICILKYTYYNL